MKCLNCGYENKKGKDICDKCGNELQSRIEDIDIEPYISHNLTDEDKAKAKDILKKGIISFVIGILILIITINVYLGKYTDSSALILIIPLIPVVILLTYGIIMTVRGSIKLSSDVSDSITNISKSPEASKIDNVVVKYVEISTIIWWSVFSVIWLIFTGFITKTIVSHWDDSGKKLLFVLVIFWIFGLFVLIKTIISIRKYKDNYKK